ncbi:MAG TPA: DUF4189 domain-containing protein [Rhizomicrobium sp.]
MAQWRSVSIACGVTLFGVGALMWFSTFSARGETNTSWCGTDWDCTDPGPPGPKPAAQYVAIAVSDISGQIGVATDAPSETAARKTAIANCLNNDCKAVIVEKDTCVAITLASDGSYFARSFDTREGARTLAEIPCMVYSKGACAKVAATPCAGDDSRTAPPFAMPPIGKDVVVDPQVSGIWEYPWNQGRWVWVIDPHGVYAFHTEAPDSAPSHSGQFMAAGGKWTLASQYGFNDIDGGTYVLPDPDTMVMTGKYGPGTWHRIKSAKSPAKK